MLQRGDTLRGLLVAPTRSTVARGVIFRTDGKTAAEAFYSVKLLRGLGLTGGKKYVVRKMLPTMRRDTLRLLLEPLAQGQANLYRSSYNLFTNNTDEVYSNQFSLLYYYVESTANLTRPPYLLQANTFRSDLTSLFSDCTSAPAITGKFSEANLIKLVQEYNRCTSHLTQLK
ncbi:hypothetical protein GCM10022407_38500 [Hymenobacter antarcticus]|uniref:Uncharacterized protein n=1 Tax=Hymenobacter antarcticus TaxID=486270 RepID=A0ABP7QZM6_9BACT